MEDVHISLRCQCIKRKHIHASSSKNQTKKKKKPQKRNKRAHHDNDEVQPTPSICKVGLETKSKPLDKHLNNENNSENFVQVHQHFL